MFDLGTEWDASARLDGLTYTYGITINGDLVRSSTSKSAFLDAIRFVNITGDLSVLTNNLSIQAYSVEVGGNLTGTGQTFVSFVEGTSAKTIEEGIANPDMIVRGIVDAQKIQQKAIGRDTFVQIGGATGWASLCREAKRGAVSNNFTAYYIFTNTQDYSASGYFAEDIDNTWSKESGKVGIIMDGTASQAFTGNNLKFQGGVIVKSGAIKFNFAQLTSNYEHNYTYTNADNRTRVTYFNSNLDGAQQTTFSHGDLEMSGGVFGADESNGYGAFRFTNIKYSGGTIDYTNSLHSDIMGDPDSLLIYIALGDWDSRVEVRTNPNNRKPFDPNDPHIIAYNQFVSERSVTEYQPFELEFEYRATNRIPTYIIVTATGSKYGDEFTGSTKSVLYVDEFSLEYDYD